MPMKRHRLSPAGQCIKQLKTIDKDEKNAEEYQCLLTELVDEILKRRLICRPFQGQPLSGIYQKLYQQIKVQLMGCIPLLIEQIELDSNHQIHCSSYLDQWLKGILVEAIKLCLTHEMLTNLAISVKKCDRSSKKRGYALNELIQGISLSGKLSCRNTVGFADEFYQMLYKDAVNKTLIYVAEKIDNFDPAKSHLMTWVNFRLNRNLYEVRRELDDPYFTKLLNSQKRQTIAHKSLSREHFWLLRKMILIKKEKDLLGTVEPLFLQLFIAHLKYRTLDSQSLVKMHLENLWESRVNQADSNTHYSEKGLINYIEEDRNQKFSRHHIRGRKDVTFREIALLKNRDGMTWQELADKYQIRLSTLSDFYQRSLKKFKHEFEDFLT